MQNLTLTNYNARDESREGIKMNNNELKSIAELDGYRFSVPSYQRGYRWGQREVRALLEDIWDFWKDNKANGGGQNSFYCLQPIVLKRKGEVYSLIDGQQRLTTIFLIIKYLQNRNLFKIEYDTRRDSAEFLENIKDRYSLPADNIDFWHFANAYKVIFEFFKNVEIDREIFAKTLLNDCKILWYEAKEEENDVFVRLNIGKIPLLESENIKALFLSKNDELDNDEIKERAEFWYESEIKARENNDLRYCVLQKIKPDDISKDEYNKPILSDDILRIEAYLKAIVKPDKKNKHYLFDYFYECYKIKV